MASNNRNGFFYSFRGQKSELSFIGPVPSGAWEGESISLLFLTSSGCLYSWVHGLVSIFEAYYSASSIPSLLLQRNLSL